MGIMAASTLCAMIFAILEMMDELPQQESFHQVDTVMEGMANLRLQLLQRLLQECKSVKVKRLFLWYEDRHRHSWLKHLNRSAIDLGRGKRQLVPAGRYEVRYQITLPAELFATGDDHDAKGGF